MAGDRGLAFVIIGLIGSTIVWMVHTDGTHVHQAINAYAARKAPAVKTQPVPSAKPALDFTLAGADEQKARLADGFLGFTPRD